MTQKGQKINFIRKLYRPQKVKGQRERRKAKTFSGFVEMKKRSERKKSPSFPFTFSSESKMLYSFRSAVLVEDERDEKSPIHFNGHGKHAEKDVNALLLSLPFCLLSDNDEV